MTTLARHVALVCVSLVIVLTAHAGPTDTAVEFYHAGLDHYFISAESAEIAALDAGTLRGWGRTGQQFPVQLAGAASAGSSPVCRFYGNPAAGLDSHFYSAFPDECAVVKQKYAFEWLLESDEVFRVAVPNPGTGACPVGTQPLYRLYNNRADVNHRYTTSTTIVGQMLAIGYIAEGYGNPPVGMCVPLQGAVVRPHCTLVASNAAPATGSSIILTAACTNNPTSYAWSDCTSTTNTCVATSTVAGPTAYTVIAINAAGPSNAPTVLVTWTGATAPPPPTSPPPPIATGCTLTTSNFTPAIRTAVTLTAVCTGQPQLSWDNGCSQLDNSVAAKSVCTTTSVMPGKQTYRLFASGIYYSVDVTWQDAPAAPWPTTCSGFGGGTITHAMGTWKDGKAVAKFTADEHRPLTADKALVIRLDLPNAAGSGGRLYYTGLPGVTYSVSVSMTPCDWSDKLSSYYVSTGPGAGYIPFVIGGSVGGFYAILIPGAPWYVNIKIVSGCTGDCAGTFTLEKPGYTY